jgi:tetratricopeptide (TPR) repeat protein
MQQYTFQVFQKSDNAILLRFLASDGRLLAERQLAPADIQRFIGEIEKSYRTAASDLADLGRQLYDWLDGPTERWLEKALKDVPGLAIHIDISERRRHLPWELLFQGVEPVLDFEREERMILEATRHHPIELVVEESGSLAGLQEHLQSFGSNHFDVFHLTGHADVKNLRPCFVMEDALGFPHEATADDIAQAFSGNWPKLVFLSGCKTGQAADQGSLPSLCEALVSAGAPAVLGWALPVGDQAASAAAATLYEQLAIGKRADEAVARARQKLLENKSPYWHLLRLYANATPLAEHVTPLQTPGRERLRIREAAAEFLDAGAKVEVCPRALFVGRRRSIQRCLRVLRSLQGQPEYAEGILLHGMGGLGKSSVAARLCERMTNHRRLVWAGRIDEKELLKVLSDKLDSREVIQILNTLELTLKQRLRLVLQGPLANQPALFVLDDFEHNLEFAGDGAAILKPEGRDILAALLTAIRDTSSESRVMVTSRYQFPIPGPTRLYLEGLESMRGAELEKKTALLPAFQAQAATSEELKTRAIALAAGNPRLLERLDKILVDQGTDHAAILAAMEAKAEEFREEILLRMLLGQQTPACRRLLALFSVYGLPVDRAAVEAVADGAAVDPHLDRAIALGLAESGKDTATGLPRYYVSSLMMPLLVTEISDQERLQACRRGARHLYETLWVKGADASLEQLLEIHRLALLANEKDIAVTVGDLIATAWVNQNRYREAEFLCMETLRLGEDYRILHTLARAEKVLGKTTEARQHYEQALALCPKIEATQAPEIAKEHAALLSNYADLLVQQGDVKRALELWNQSLALKEQIGDVQGKAATLANMAWLAGKQGDHQRERQLNLEAAKALATIRAWLDLVTVLANLGNSDDHDATAFLAQAFWLALRVEVPIDDAVNLTVAFIQKLGAEAEAAPLIATTGMFLAQVRGKDHPKQAEMQQLATAMLAACAMARTIPPEKIVDWITKEGLNDPDRFLPALNGTLEAIVGEKGWLFDRQLFTLTVTTKHS